MNKKYYYLASLFFVFVLPAVITGYFVLQQISLVRICIFVFNVTLFGSIWDIWATRHGRRDPVWLWQFNFRDNLGIKVFGLPIEEYLFYVCSSVYVIFMWEAIQVAIDTRNIGMIIFIPSMSLWSMLAILIPYLYKVKGDRVL